MERNYTFAEKVGIGVAVVLATPVVLLFLILLFLALYWLALAFDFVGK